MSDLSEPADRIVGRTRPTDDPTDPFGRAAGRARPDDPFDDLASRATGLDDPAGPDGRLLQVARDPFDELPRPAPPRTWRDRLDDLLAGGTSVGRIVAVLAAVAVAGVVGWRMLAPPAPPPEVEIPFAEPAAPGGGDASTAPAEEAAAPDLPPGAAPATGAAPGGSAAPEATPAEVVVHVAGAVASPGVQRLPTGARVVDAVDAAGGATPDADLARVNLAAPLVDGQQVYLVRQGEVPPPAVATGAPTGAGPGGAAGGDGPIDINRATATELEELPGVGPATAEAIISHRERHGPFASVDDLLDVRGIGDAKLEQIRERATV